MPISPRRLALVAMSGVFFCWAYFQLNDPDPVVWIGVYGTAAAASLLAAIIRLPRVLTLVLIAGAVGGAILQGIRVVAGGEFIFAEHGREMLGLLIVAAWTFVALRWSHRRDRADAPARKSSEAV